MKDFYGKMGVAAFGCFIAGLADVFFAGFLKATWKMLYATEVCDFQAINALFFPVQSLGFLLAGLGMLLYVFKTRRKDKSVTLRSVPPVFAGTMLFVGMMVAGLGAMCTGLSILSVRRKRGIAILFFALCFVFSLGMGYLSSRDNTSATVNWIAQTVNCFGQACFMLGSLILTRKDKTAPAAA